MIKRFYIPQGDLWLTERVGVKDMKDEHDLKWFLEKLSDDNIATFKKMDFLDRTLYRIQQVVMNSLRTFLFGKKLCVLFPLLCLLAMKRK
jgi:hypothetical protein